MVFQVIDTGSGIDPEVLPQIFEPFFTKGKPEGTGLGLYVSHGIVERHGGELHAANSNGGGAILTLKLPLDAYDMTEML
jgi:signal transduction histidine kinase